MKEFPIAAHQYESNAVEEPESWRDELFVRPSFPIPQPPMSLEPASPARPCVPRNDEDWMNYQPD